MWEESSRKGISIVGPSPSTLSRSIDRLYMSKIGKESGFIYIPTVDIDINIDRDGDGGEKGKMERMEEEVVKAASKIGYPIVAEYIDREGRRERKRGIKKEGELRAFFASDIYRLDNSNSSNGNLSISGLLTLRREVEGRELQVTVLRDREGGAVAFPER